MNLHPAENVNDFPADPTLEAVAWPVVVKHGGHRVAASLKAWRLLEKGHAPRYFIPRDDVNLNLIIPSNRFGLGDDDGLFSYFDVVAGGQIAMDAAWMMTSLRPELAELTDHFAFSARLIDECTVGGTRVRGGRDAAGDGWAIGNLTGLARVA